MDNIRERDVEDIFSDKEFNKILTRERYAIKIIGFETYEHLPVSGTKSSERYHNILWSTECHVPCEKSVRQVKVTCIFQKDPAIESR